MKRLMLLWKIKDFFTSKWFIVIVKTFFLLVELETEIDSLEKEIKYIRAQMSQCFAVNLNLYVYFLSLISLYATYCGEKTTSAHDQTKQEAETHPANWMDGQTDRQMDGQK